MTAGLQRNWDAFRGSSSADLSDVLISFSHACGVEDRRRSADSNPCGNHCKAHFLKKSAEEDHQSLPAANCLLSSTRSFMKSRLRSRHRILVHPCCRASCCARSGVLRGIGRLWGFYAQSGRAIELKGAGCMGRGEPHTLSTGARGSLLVRFTGWTIRGVASEKVLSGAALVPCES
jgi:hypothetical protein